MVVLVAAIVAVVTVGETLDVVKAVRLTRKAPRMILLSAVQSAAVAVVVVDKEVDNQLAAAEVAAATQAAVVVAVVVLVLAVLHEAEVVSVFGSGRVLRGCILADIARTLPRVVSAACAVVPSSCLGMTT